MEILNILKGGSLSRTSVVSHSGKKFVRKSISAKENREYGLVRWQSQIRKIQTLNKFLPDSSVYIENMGEDGDSYYYEIPYYEDSHNCVDALLYGESPELLASKISILLERMAEVDYGYTKGALAVYFREEVLTPLYAALELATTDRLPLQPNELSQFIDAVSEAVETARTITLQLANVQVRETLTHGNLTLENIIWDSRSKKPIMIDPYAETYCEIIAGDISQLMQSSRSGYEYISRMLDAKVFPIEQYPASEIPVCLTSFSTCLTKILSAKDWFDEVHLNILTASQFIRMFPFKQAINPRQGVCFLYHGIQLLKASLC